MKNPAPYLHSIRRRRGAAAAHSRELDRESRAPRLLDAPADAAGRMRALDVAVIGVGSIGSYVADLLARLALRSLLLVDRGVFKPESLLTHPVHPRHVGQSKAQHAGERAKAVYPDARVLVHAAPVEELALDALVGLSAVVLASDNLACELEVSQRCRNLGLPLIQAAVHGSTLTAQVRLLTNQDTAGPCLACGNVAADWRALDEGTVFACAGDSAAAEPQRMPTVSPPQLCALAASLAVTELTRMVLDLGGPATNREIQYCGFNQSTQSTPLHRRADCPADHDRWLGRAWDGALSRATLHHLLVAAGDVGTTDLSRVAVAVEGYRFARLGACACPEHPLLGRFVPAGVLDDVCSGCGMPLAPHPFYTHALVPGIALKDHLRRPLGLLGATAPTSVRVRGEGGNVFFHAARHPQGGQQ